MTGITSDWSWLGFIVLDGSGAPHMYPAEMTLYIDANGGQYVTIIAKGM